MSSAVSWTQGNELIAQVGREDYLAQRIQAERQARGWSQERLAKEMGKAACPLPQSAISKIENPAAGGRRAITVDEAIGFARVFEIPLGELMLPPEFLTQARIWRDLAAGPDLLRSHIHAKSRYRDLIQSLAAATAGDGYWAKQLVDEFDAARQRIEAQGGDAGDSIQVQFLLDVMQARDAAQKARPQSANKEQSKKARKAKR
jgi:transcriptional regulator with XRE-family HTH domain